jgi:hydrogenase nickel incorporation protein HypA/HybF
MHELSLIKGVMTEVLRISEVHAGATVDAVRLRVGTLQNVVPDAMNFAFEAAASGTPIEGARLDMDVIPAHIRCHHCATEYEAVGTYWICPNCEAAGGDLLQGDELILDSITLSDDTRKEDEA